MYIIIGKYEIGDVCMFDLKNEDIVIEINELINGIDKVKEEVDIYCDLMKQMFLAGSGRN